MAGSADSPSFGKGTDDAGFGPWTGGGGSVPGTGAAGLSGGTELWSRYQCPVCSHQDRVTVAGPATNVECSHCGTLLVVSLGAPTSESVSVRVALDLPLT